MQQDIVYSIFYIFTDYPILHYTNLTILRTQEHVHINRTSKNKMAFNIIQVNII